MNFKNIKHKKYLKIIIAIVIPFIVLYIITFNILLNYLPQDKGEIFNIAEIDFKSLDTNSYLYHYDQLGYTTIIGADLSEHNKDIDFNKLKEKGIEFVFLRIGWRGYRDPTIHIDARFEEYYKKAKDAGLNIGVYFFSQAINEDEAVEEAEFVIENLINKQIDMYVAYDCESISFEEARTDTITKHQKTLNARAFLKTIENKNYSPILYTNLDWIRNHYEFSLLREYPIWYAQYNFIPQYKGNFIIWQYSGGTLLEEISTENEIDLNLMILKRGY